MKNFLVTHAMAIAGAIGISLLIATGVQTARVSKLQEALGAAESRLTAAATSMLTLEQLNDDVHQKLHECVQRIRDMVAQRTLDQQIVSKELAERDKQFNKLQRQLTKERQQRAVLWKESVDCENFSEIRFDSVCPALFERVRERSMRTLGGDENGDTGSTG